MTGLSVGVGLTSAAGTLSSQVKDLCFVSLNIILSLTYHRRTVIKTTRDLV